MQRLIRSLWLLFILNLTTGAVFAQDDDCDPSSSIQETFGTARDNFGINCMQYAINVSMNDNHNRLHTLSDGSGLPFFVAKPKSSPIPGGEWTTELNDNYSWEDDSELKLKMYSRPGAIMNLGPLVNLEFYTLALDTGIVKVDLSNILSTVRKEFDEYEDELDVKISQYYEDGKLYGQIVGNIKLGEGIKPVKMGEIIAYFFQSICFSVNISVKYMEMEAVHAIPNKTLDYWNESQLTAALKLKKYFTANSGIKEGRFNWGENNFGVQLDNYGDYMIAYIRIDNTTDSNRDKLVTELNAWLQKKKPKTVETAETKVFGKTPWVALKFNLKGMKGSDIMSDYYEDVIRDWGEDITDEAKDILD